MNSSASSAVAVRFVSTTTSERSAARPARSSRRRGNSRGWEVTGSARQTTTSSARSRSSPNVAVLSPTACEAAPPAPSTGGPAGSITAPMASASATAARWLSQSVCPRPKTSGSRAAPRIAADASTASAKSTSLPSMRADAAASTARSANHSSPIAQVPVTRSSAPAATATSMSSQPHPQPAQVAACPVVTTESTVDDRANQQRGWGRARAQSMLEASASTAGGARRGAGRPSATVIEVVTTQASARRSIPTSARRPALRRTRTPR